MARKIKYSKEDILEKSIDFIKEYGYSKLTVRELAKYIGCSTQPIFKNYSNFDEYKVDLKKYLRKDYESFIYKIVDKEDYLYTISYAYALYVRQVLDTDRNKVTIDAMTKQYKISIEKAEKVYQDVRFYTHGIATQLCVKSIKLSDKELQELIKNNIEINLRRG